MNLIPKIYYILELIEKEDPITSLLYALNYTRDKILETFYSYNKYEYDIKTKSWFTNFQPENYKRPIKLLFDLLKEKIIKKF